MFLKRCFILVGDNLSTPWSLPYRWLKNTLSLNCLKILFTSVYKCTKRDFVSFSCDLSACLPKYSITKDCFGFDFVNIFPKKHINAPIQVATGKCRGSEVHAKVSVMMLNVYITVWPMNDHRIILFCPVDLF